MASRTPFRRARRRIRARSRAAFARVARTEALETRTLLAAFTVNSTDDGFDVNPGNGFAIAGNGLTTLRSAIQEANAVAGGDVIVLPSGTYSLTRSGTGEDGSFNGDLDITGQLRILGAGAARTFIDAGDLDRALHVLAGANVTLSGVTIRNGTALNAGGILNAGTLTLTDVIIEDNVATGAANSVGGGIGNSSGTLTMTRVTVRNNSASINGGGLYSSSGTVTIVDGSFVGNAASEDGGGLSIFNGNVSLTGTDISSNTAGIDGAGLSTESATVTLTNATVSSNIASGDAGGINSIGNGTVRLFSSTVTANQAADFGGGIRSFEATLGVTHTTISSNTAGRGGGGIDNDAGIAELTNSLLFGNSAGENGGGLNTFQGQSGISNTTISGNQATLNGGGVMNAASSATTIVNSTIVNNSAAQEGGGIANLNIVNLGNSIVAQNTATISRPDLAGAFTTLNNNLVGDGTGSTGIVNGVNSDSVGTAIVPLDPQLSVLQDNGGPTLSHVPLDGSPVIDAGNSNGAAAIDQLGRSRNLDGDQEGTPVVDIGAVEFNGGQRIFTVNTTVDSFDAFLGDGAAVDSGGSTSLRAAIQEANAVAGEARIELPAGTYTLSLAGAAEGSAAILSGLEDLDVTDHVTIVGAGQGTTIIDGQDLYRLFHVQPNIRLTLESMTLQNGQDEFGGALYSSGGNVRLVDVTISSSSATGSASSHGGAIANDTGQIVLERVTISSNSAAVDGGGIYSFNAYTQIIDSNIDSNTATVNGGGLSSINSTIDIDGSTISNNSASDDGGGLALSTGTLGTIDLSTISGNSASSFGGGIHNVSSALTVTQVTVASNSATVSGGGVNNESGNVSIVASTVHSNSATVDGGGIDNFQGTVIVRASTVSGNTATGNGAGVVNYNSSNLQLLGSTVANNSASGTGGGVWSTGTIQIENSIVATNSATTASPDINGSVVTLGTNFIGNSLGLTGAVNGASGDQVGTGAFPIDPQLSPLGDYGGPTLTHIPLPGSPVIDTGSVGNSGSLDQRSSDRFQDSNLDGSIARDIGATEFLGVTLTAAVGTPMQVSLAKSGDDLLVTDDFTSQVHFRLPADGTDMLLLVGGSDDDSLTVDFSGGNPLPFGGINLTGDGATVGDAITLSGGTATTVAYSIPSANDGSVTVDGRTINYTSIEPITDSLIATNRTLTFSNSTDAVTLADAGAAGDGLMQVTRRSPTSLLEFQSPTGSLTIDTLNLADTVRFDSVDSQFSPAVTINTGSGADSVDTTLLSSNVTVNGGDDPDTIQTGAGNDMIFAGSGHDVVSSGAGNDNVFGGAHRDRINGGEGNDTLLGQGSSQDTLTGGAGDDVLHGGSGNDFIEESADNDFSLTNSSLTGDGNDILISVERAIIRGGDSGNRLDATAFTGDTTLDGANGNDTLLGGSSYNNLIDTGTGNDLMIGGDGTDVIVAGMGRDTAYGNGGRDFINGNGGSGDQLSGGPGDDLINGGAGNDFLFETTSGELILRDNRMEGFGVDRLRGIEKARLFGTDADNHFNAARFPGYVVMYGSGGNDTLVGGTGPDLIFGGDGNDSVRGGNGLDTIYGESGNDTLKGGSAPDLIYGGDGQDAIDGQDGNDQLLGDMGNDTVLGGGGDDRLLGGGGNDTALGGLGADTVSGNAGTDVLAGGSGSNALPDPGDQVMGDLTEINEAFAVNFDWLDVV